MSFRFRLDPPRLRQQLARFREVGVGYDGSAESEAALELARAIAREHGARLSACQAVSILFSSGPLGPPDHLIPEGDPADAAQLIELVGARGHRVFAGRLERASLGFAERAAAKAVHAPEGDRRAWNAIDAFAGEIASELSPEKAAR